MNQSTTFAQVATNLLNVLQGYSKTIRLLLVMFLTLTVSANVWGADYSKNEVWSFTTTGNSNWSGHNSGYCGACGSKSSFNVYKTNITNFSNIDFSKYENVSLTIYVKAGTNSGTNSYTVKLIDANGNQVSTYTSTKSSGMGTGSNSSSAKESSVTFSPTVAFNGYKIEFPAKAYITQTRYVLTYDDKAASCTEPTITFSNGSYTVGGSVLDLSTLFNSNSNGAVTYSVTNANGTGATISGSNFTATAAGSATVSATQAADGSYCDGSATATITVNKQQTTITLSEAGNTRNPSGTFYVGESYTLPSTTTATCGDKTFVGWSTVTIDNSAGKPASNFYKPDTEVTLEEENTFYAVFAEGGGLSDANEVLLNYQGGTSSDLNNTEGLSVSGNGSDYAVSNAPYRVKLDGTGDYILYHNESKPYISQVYFKVKMLGGNATSKMTIKTSDDGSKYTSQSECTISGNQNDVKTFTVDINTYAKYVQLYFTKGSNVGFGPLIIYTKSSSFQNYTTECGSQTDCSLLTFATNIPTNHTATCTQNTSATALTVSAKYDGNTTGVTYQWYSNTSNSNRGGTAINGAINASYTPVTTTVGTKYYYCVATYDECTITSNVATVTIIAPVPTFTVTFDSDGGSAVASQNIEDGQKATKPANPTKNGYEFAGWYNGNTEFDFSTSITGDLTLKAKWNIITYNIEYTGLEGATHSNPATYTIETATITFADPSNRDGYVFKGWTPASIAKGSTGDKTVTAQWTTVHTVNWMVGSNPVKTETVEHEKAITETPSDPADGAIGSCANKFMGWSETSLGSAEGQSAPSDLCSAADMKSKHSNVTGDKTFYAVFASLSGSGAPTAYTAGDIGNFVLAAKNGSKWYALPANPTVSSGKIQGVEITVTTTSGVEHVTTANASGYIWTIANVTNGQTISDGSKYIYHSNGGASGTNLTYGNSTSYTWKIEKESAGLTFKAMNEGVVNDRGMLVQEKQFGGYSLSNETTSGYYRISVLPISDGASYSNYVTNCCEVLPVTNLQVSGVTEKSATLTWTKPSSTTGITELQIRNTNDDVIVDDINPTTTTATINGLDECIKYNYYVVSVGAECEVSSETVTAQPFGDAKTVHYDYNGGSGSPESFTTSCDDDKREIILPAATRPGYTFEGWYDSEENKVGDAGATYDPATSPITLYAHWTEITYQLNHSGSNYTITENKTSIKSSETPFTLHYTCTGDYGLPATISITGGGKSWTVGTDYTWEVAADKQSATLTINQTTITADVTITINVATRYTVTFVHNDKGVFSGSEAIEVLSSENTITLPTVTDVSCGFYDTFEGWIISNDEYVESTTKPATVYAGGASYKVTGDCTFRALYSKCEGDATQVYRKVTSTGEVTDGTYILVATTTTGTSYVYSGNGGNTYGLYVSGLTTDDGDFSSTLPEGTDPISITANDGKFAMYNANESKYLTYTNSSNTLNTSDSEANVWKLTDGSEKINGKECPEGALTPSNDARVLQLNSGSTRFACYQNTDNYPYVFLYKLIEKCTNYYSTNPTCVKPVGVHIVYNANAMDAIMSCNTQDRTYKVVSGENQYPELASQLQFCTNATREGYTLAGWNTQANGQGTTYNINQNYYRLPVSGDLDGDNWITLNLYAVWKQSVKFDLGNATGGTGVPDAIVENGECVLPEPTAEQLGTIPCAYEFYAWSETSVNATQSKPTVWMPGDTYTGSATTLYAVYRYAEGMGGSDTYYFTFNKSGKTYCITAKHNSYDRFVVAEQSTGLIFGLENGYLYYLDENGVKNYVYYEGSSTYVTTTTTYPNNANQKTTFVEGDNGTTIVTPAISGRYLQMPSSYTD